MHHHTRSSETSLLSTESEYTPQEYGHLYSEYLEKHPHYQEFVLSDDGVIDPELEMPVTEL